MNTELLKTITEDLLNKFGAGDHKPGSGSAAAFQGMISSKLLVTVIYITNKKEHRQNYTLVLPKLLKMGADIDKRIYPELCRLFQEDSVQFDKAIQLRKKRDEEMNPHVKNELDKQASEELKFSINIPLEIAILCTELSEIAMFVFDNAFQSARGDSQVALSSAFAGLSGCLSIVHLNLLSLSSDEQHYIEDIVEQTNLLKFKYQELISLVNEKVVILEDESKNKLLLYKDVNLILKNFKSGKYLTDAEIEKAAIALQNSVWKYRGAIFGKKVPQHPIETLKPQKIFKKALGYNCYSVDEIPQTDGFKNYEAAGEINQQKKLVLISNKFNSQTKNFTAAHELGHALLHKQVLLHRDRPIDGSGYRTSRNQQEYQADKFAAFFLMPEKQVAKIFKELFLTEKFIIDENSAFNLAKKGSSKLREDCKNVRGLSRKIASAESYNNTYFKSISELFNVSVETMAIRLEELGLVEF